MNDLYDVLARLVEKAPVWNGHEELDQALAIVNASRPSTGIEAAVVDPTPDGSQADISPTSEGPAPTNTDSDGFQSEDPTSVEGIA